MKTHTYTTIGMVLGALVAGLVVAAPATAAAPGPAAQTWLRAEIVESEGISSGQFVDSRQGGRTLVFDPDSEFHYLRHVGVDVPGIVLNFTFTDRQLDKLGDLRRGQRAVGYRVQQAIKHINSYACIRVVVGGPRRWRGGQGDCQANGRGGEYPQESVFHRLFLLSIAWHCPDMVG